MILGPRSPRVQRVAKLAKRKAREESGCFLLEGVHGVTEALRYRPRDVVELFVTPEALEKRADVGDAAHQAGTPVEIVSDDTLQALADTVTPQGFVAVVKQFSETIHDIFAAAPRLVVILEEVRDPGNAGTIIRVADAVGADAVVFSGSTVDPFSPKVVRSTVGSLFHVPVAFAEDVRTVCRDAKAAGVTVLAADMGGKNILDARAEGMLSNPTAWLFGTEAHGLSHDARTLADGVVSIPLYGLAESLNLSTAVSVCLFESAFEQRAAMTADN